MSYTFRSFQRSAHQYVLIFSVLSGHQMFCLIIIHLLLTRAKIVQLKSSTKTWSSYISNTRTNKHFQRKYTFKGKPADVHHARSWLPMKSVDSVGDFYRQKKKPEAARMLHIVPACFISWKIFLRLSKLFN